ncbi:MAG: hypothetical protein IH627_02920 [Rubrivivax sp.]|nr:hypothetical protein [Rubrivivax sp.]
MPHLRQRALASGLTLNAVVQRTSQRMHFFHVAKTISLLDLLHGMRMAGIVPMPLEER